MPEARDQGLVARLSAAGCVAAEEEADELTVAANGDAHLLESLVRRRIVGEPLAWVTGSTEFLGAAVVVHRGVYVPRRQTEPLAARATALLPEAGLAVDLCTGSGALALALMRARPRATVFATDVDPAACRCAAANSVTALLGDLDAPLPTDLAGHVDVVVSVPPYVPRAALSLLPRDARDYEPLGALDGGPAGIDVLLRVVEAAGRLLGSGGHLLVECGVDQPALLAGALGRAGLELDAVLVDEDGDVRGLVARRDGA